MKRNAHFQPLVSRTANGMVKTALVVAEPTGLAVTDRKQTKRMKGMRHYMKKTFSPKARAFFKYIEDSHKRMLFKK